MCAGVGHTSIIPFVETVGRMMGCVAAGLVLELEVELAVAAGEFNMRMQHRKVSKCDVTVDGHGHIFTRAWKNSSTHPSISAKWHTMSCRSPSPREKKTKKPVCHNIKKTGQPTSPK